LTDSDLHRIFGEWAAWVRSKRLFAPSPNPQSIIGSLVRERHTYHGIDRANPRAEIEIEPLEAQQVELPMAVAEALEGWE